MIKIVPVAYVTAVILAFELSAQLANSAVTVTTGAENASLGTDAGNITFAAPVTFTLQSPQPLISFGNGERVGYAAGHSGTGIAGHAFTINKTPYTLVFSLAALQTAAAAKAAGWLCRRPIREYVRPSDLPADNVLNIYDDAKPAHVAKNPIERIARIP